MRVTHAGLHLCRTGTFKMQDVFDMVYSLLVFVNIRVILYKTYVVLICGKYNTLRTQSGPMQLFKELFLEGEDTVLQD